MRISDWSSDVCSSDLLRRLRRPSSAGVPEPCSGTPWRPMEDTRRSGLRALFGRLRHHLRRELLAQGRLDPGRHRRVVLEVLAGVLLALADAFALAAVPGAGLLDPLGRSEEQTSALQSIMPIQSHV